MAAIDLLSGLMQVIPNTAAAAVFRERAEALKDVILTNEARLKLATEVADHLRKENELLKQEVDSLKSQLAAQALTDDFEHRHGVLFRKGDETPICRACQAVMYQVGMSYHCTKCKYQSTIPHASVAVSESPRRGIYGMGNPFGPDW